LSAQTPVRDFELHMEMVILEVLPLSYSPALSLASVHSCDGTIGSSYALRNTIGTRIWKVYGVSAYVPIGIPTLSI
jgi:hypothetical protein